MVEASISPEKVKLPGLADGWRFAFDKQSKKFPHSTTYILVTDESPDIIDGCMIFQLKDKVVPYMAFVEVAPHNYGKKKKYDYVAGCLIAFAFKQTYIQGKGDYQGWLAFDVREEDPEDQVKLMAIYSKKYGAVKVDDTQMYLMDDAGDTLIEKYLGKGGEYIVEE